ncbi:hypothetical protein E4T56_gene11164 [Termitomyces sp. T112]|nr:hypothetical protein E4T56_gene11164 [Termitomyces sp. T112]
MFGTRTLLFRSLKQRTARILPDTQVRQETLVNIRVVASLGSDPVHALFEPQERNFDVFLTAMKAAYPLACLRSYVPYRDNVARYYRGSYELSPPSDSPNTYDFASGILDSLSARKRILLFMLCPRSSLKLGALPNFLV